MVSPSNTASTSWVSKQAGDKEREAAGVSDHLVRVSVGLEDAADLIADFDQALTAAKR